uniref:Uncharacterized protein n=1 Tax=Anopheles darlingi TaxID=43151 RepID=A0A2M4D4L6_ANODA
MSDGLLAGTCGSASLCVVLVSGFSLSFSPPSLSAFGGRSSVIFLNISCCIVIDFVTIACFFFPFCVFDCRGGRALF